METDSFNVRSFKLGVRPEQPVPILIAALREGMLKLAGREGDGAIINWLSADDVSTVAPIVQAAGDGTRQGGRGPHLRGAHRRRRHGARHGPLRHRRLPQRAGLRRLPRLAGPRRGARRDVAALEGGRPQGAPWRPSPTRWSTTSSCGARRRSAASTSSATSTTASPPRRWPSSRSASTPARPSATSPRSEPAMSRWVARGSRRGGCSWDVAVPVSATRQADPGAPACSPDGPPVVFSGSVSSPRTPRPTGPCRSRWRPGTTRVEVGYRWDDVVPLPDLPVSSLVQTVLDLGLWDEGGVGTPAGFRGWSGSRQGKTADGPGADLGAGRHRRARLPARPGASRAPGTSTSASPPSRRSAPPTR